MLLVKTHFKATSALCLRCLHCLWPSSFQFEAIFTDETLVEQAKKQGPYRPRKAKRALLAEVCGRGHPLVWLLPCHNVGSSFEPVTNNYTVWAARTFFSVPKIVSVHQCGKMIACAPVWPVWAKFSNLGSFWDDLGKFWFNPSGHTLTALKKDLRCCFGVELFVQSRTEGWVRSTSWAICEPMA